MTYEKQTKEGIHNRKSTPKDALSITLLIYKPERDNVSVHQLVYIHINIKEVPKDEQFVK